MIRVFIPEKRDRSLSHRNHLDDLYLAYIFAVGPVSRAFHFTLSLVTKRGKILRGKCPPQRPDASVKIERFSARGALNGKLVFSLK